MPSKTMEEFLAESGSYDINNGRMRNTANAKKMTVFVEGELDEDFYNSYCREDLKLVVKSLGNKKRVLERMKSYETSLEKTGSDSYAFFCVDMDYDYAIQFFEKALKKESLEHFQFVSRENLFYQVFDTENLKGYNDLESLLFLGSSFKPAMAKIIKDRDRRELVQRQIQKIAAEMGCFRVADRLIRDRLGIPEDVSLLCNRVRDSLNNGMLREKFGVKFLVSWGLLDLNTLESLDMEMVGEQVRMVFGEEEYAEHLDELIRVAHDIHRISERKGFPRQMLMRGHDMTEILARVVLMNRKVDKDDDMDDLVKATQLELEGLFMVAASSMMGEIKNYPLGKILN